MEGQHSWLQADVHSLDRRTGQPAGYELTLDAVSGTGESCGAEGCEDAVPRDQPGATLREQTVAKKRLRAWLMASPEPKVVEWII